MPTVQVCQQYRLVAMHPKQAKSFSEATVQTVAAENVGPEARRVGMVRGHTRVRKSVHDGEFEAGWACCTLGRHLELSDGGSGW